MDGDLTCLRLEYFAFQTDDIPDIQLLEILIRILADTVPCYIGLDISALVQNIAKGSLSHNTLLHNTPCKRHLFSFHLIIMFLDICSMTVHVISRYLKRILSIALQVCQLLPANLSQLIHIFLYFLLLLCHDSFSLLLFTYSVPDPLHAVLPLHPYDSHSLQYCLSHIISIE